MKTLSIPMSVLQELIELKREYAANSPETGELLSLADLPNSFPDKFHVQLYDIIHDLPLDQKQELAALIWTGRGEFEGDFASALDYAACSGVLNESYLGGKPLERYLPRAIQTVRAEGYKIN
jgi:Protein of unknown function (DUF3775)